MDFIGERNEGCICFLVCFTPGCPPCMRRCNGHGDGALHRGRSCLRHQSLLLRLHPERNQVHLPQEVCSCSPWPNVTSQGFCFLKCCFWPCFLVSTPASIGAPLLLHSLSTFFESGFFFFSPFLFWGSRSCTHCHLLSRIRTHNLYLLSMFFSFFLFTAGLLSSPLTVWGSSVTSPSQQGPPLPYSVLAPFSLQQGAGFSMWTLSWILKSRRKIQLEGMLLLLELSYVVLQRNKNSAKLLYVR